MRNALVVGLCVCGLASAADPAYAGKWKMNLAKSNFGESTIMYEPVAGGAIKMTTDGQSYTFTVVDKAGNESSVTIDHVNHPVVTRCFDSSTTAPEMKDGALQQ